MNEAKVVHLGEVRSLLTQLEQVRSLIVECRLEGIHLTVREIGGAEQTFAAGVYFDNHEAALLSALKTARKKMLKEEKKPLKLITQR